MDKAENQKKLDLIGYKGLDLQNIEIKPGFNTNWYTDCDSYSEGEIEDIIIRLILSNKEPDFTKTICQNFNWSTYYHLSHIRENILNWYPFAPDSSILEIGCGMGSITDMLCQKCKKVTAVELSKKRATATALRCRERENLEIIVGNLNDIEFTEKFDYITLIGVLEYQGTYTDSDNPCADFLKKVKTLLKPNGKLLIAIENKYGIKYWCGAREDHTGVPFDGMNQYQVGNNNGKTFSKQELTELLEQSGFPAHYFYYPMPDYKLPTVVYSQNYLPQDGQMGEAWPYYIPDSGTLIANEKNLYEDIVKNNVFEFFANSFLVECSCADEETGKVCFASLSRFRKREHRTGTRITNNGHVEKFSLTGSPESLRHIQQTFDNQMNLKNRGLRTLPTLYEHDSLTMNYNANPTLTELFEMAYRDRNFPLIWACYDRLWKELLQSSDEVPASENIFYEIEIDTPESGIVYGPILKIGSLDLLPRNCFLDNNELVWFDQEWIMDNIPAGYILYRELTTTYRSQRWRESILSPIEIFEHFGIDGRCLQMFDQFEAIFENLILDIDHYLCYSQFADTDPDTYRTNIARLCNPADSES